MNWIISLAFVIGGIVLLVLGYHEMHSVQSSFSHLLTGSPSDKSVWMLVAGAIATAAGLIGLGARK
jgi:ABC-type uncharacterized transport system permease subunit